MTSTQKTIAFVSRFSFLVSRFSFLAISVFLIATFASAQIKIKEKVEIDPAATTQTFYPAATFEPCGLHPSVSNLQYVYSCSAFPVEPYQQLFLFQSGSALKFSAYSNYKIEITEGNDYAYMERTAYTDSLGNFHESEYLGSLITGLPGYLLSGTGEYEGLQQTGTMLRENPTNYYIHFDNYSFLQTSVTVRITDLNTQETTDWVTKIVNPQLQIINQQLENDTLLHYYNKDVSLQLYNINSAGCQHPGYGGCPPNNVTFNIEIIEGQQYGSIKNELTGDISTSFTGISFTELYVFTYYANGLQPDSSAVVRIRHSSSDAEITPMEISFVVKRNTIPPPSEGGSIYVKMDKETVMPGDTVNINLQWINEVNDTIEFLEMQRFIVSLAEGSEYGTILDNLTGDTSDTFTEIGKEFKVITTRQIQKSQAKIIIVAEADLMIWTRPVSMKNKTEEKEPATDRVDDGGGGITPDIIIIGNHLVGVGEIRIVKNTPVEIMLGETKYFGVKKKTETGELKIEEIKTNYGEEPKFPEDADGWVWQKTDVWGEEPLSILKGEKLGVYWEKEKPVWNGSTVKGNIPKGLIRLIGKYWEDTETYRVKLDAKTQDEKTTSLELETKKPKKLHNSKSGLKKEMTKYKDIDGTEKNIDEIIIKNAGKYGIPPQYLKGQMFVEAGKNTNTGTFFPSYRYEPYTTQWDKNLKSWSGKFFFKDKNSADFSDVPNHQNVKYMNYWTTAKTVWEIIEENSQVTSVSNPKHYGKRNSDHTLDFDRDHFPWLQEKYDEILKIEQARKDIKKDEQKVDSANYKMSKWLKEKWKDGKASTEVAQTRCASSYGLLQMMYTTARDQKSYSASEVPEKLNELSLFSHWVEYQSDLLGGFINSNNWTDGFESTFKTQVVKKWNKATSYPNKYFSNSKLFIPQ